MRKLLFENVTCSRCGGSGHYSYCQMHGTTCFKCHGDGAVLTARGKAAQAWLTEKRKVAAGELKVGDSYLLEGIPGFTASEWIKVTGFEAEGAFALVGTDKLGKTMRFNVTADYKVRKAWTAEEKKAQAAEALAFQATLTKAGTVRKRKLAVAA